MWEEDPRWQGAQFKMLVGVGLVFGLLRIGMAVFLWEWRIEPGDMFVLTVLAALLAYGALVWAVGNGTRLVLRHVERRRRRLR
jgi:hypothetical protein